MISETKIKKFMAIKYENSSGVCSLFATIDLNTGRSGLAEQKKKFIAYTKSTIHGQFLSAW